MAEETSLHGSSRPRSARPADAHSGADVGWGVTGTLISGMTVWGGAGWLIDRWLDTRLFTAIGILLGVSVAIYVVVVKYGAVDVPADARTAGSTRGGRRSQPRTQKGQR